MTDGECFCAVASQGLSTVREFVFINCRRLNMVWLEPDHCRAWPKSDLSVTKATMTERLS